MCAQWGSPYNLMYPPENMIQVTTQYPHNIILSTAYELTLSGLRQRTTSILWNWVSFSCHFSGKGVWWGFCRYAQHRPSWIQTELLQIPLGLQRYTGSKEQCGIKIDNHHTEYICLSIVLKSISFVILNYIFEDDQVSCLPCLLSCRYSVALAQMKMLTLKGLSDSTIK